MSAGAQVALSLSGLSQRIHARGGGRGWKLRRFAALGDKICKRHGIRAISLRLLLSALMEFRSAFPNVWTFTCGFLFS